MSLQMLMVWEMSGILSAYAFNIKHNTTQYTAVNWNSATAKYPKTTIKSRPFEVYVQGPTTNKM